MNGNVSAIEGAANVDENGYITTDEKINGVVSATVDNRMFIPFWAARTALIFQVKKLK